MGLVISQRIQNSWGQNQKELHLKEQLKAIKAELGEDEVEDVLNSLESRLTSLCLTEEARVVCDREFHRLKITAPQSPEYSTLRQFIEWILELPWGISSLGSSDLNKAREILDRDHFGLEKVKKRIIEFLAVHKLTNKQKNPILCLTGPPGVGKTSLARSIAESLGRKFVSFSLGGLTDEAEIKGHRRTYIGSRPGRIISSLKKAGVNNPVFLLDELDKMTPNIKGDPGSALLDALDPEQNTNFTDSYLEIPFDLSNVLFILTANVLEQIPTALRDRLEVVEINSYTLDEKISIAKQHLWPKELVRHGLSTEDLMITDEAIKKIIRGYTWEAGCRELNRQLGNIIRSRAIDKVENKPLKKSNT
jgi:ATP-dependent Lon protease